MEKDDFDIPVRFSIFFRNLALAMFFLPILPIGVIFSITAIGIEFWIAKWVLLKRSTSSIMYSGHLTEEITPEYDFCILCYAMGLAFKEIILEI